MSYLPCAKDSYPLIQFLVHIRACTFFGSRRLLYLFRTHDAILKEDSEATVVIGILRRSHAIAAKSPCRCALSFHQSRMSKLWKLVKSKGGSSRYASRGVFPLTMPLTLRNAKKSYKSFKKKFREGKKINRRNFSEKHSHCSSQTVPLILLHRLFAEQSHVAQ